MYFKLKKVPYFLPFKMNDPVPGNGRDSSAMLVKAKTPTIRIRDRHIFMMSSRFCTCKKESPSIWEFYANNFPFRL